MKSFCILKLKIIFPRYHNPQNHKLFSRLKSIIQQCNRAAKTITFFPKLVELNKSYEKANQRRYQSGSF